MNEAVTEARRFSGVRRLYGEAACASFHQAHVGIIGVGGVGSWVAEALARSGIGRMTLVDMDHIAESNLNRQIHALEDTLGQAKGLAMQQRIEAINPACIVHVVDDFATPENLDSLLGQGFDFVVDAIDQARTKAAIIAWCQAHQVRLITSGGAGGRVDATRIRVDDLARTTQDALLARVRTILRKTYGYPGAPGKKFGIPCVYSIEPLQKPHASCDAAQNTTGLNCAGYGSAVSVTASFGMVMAGEVLNRLAATQ